MADYKWLFSLVSVWVVLIIAGIVGPQYAMRKELKESFKQLQRETKYLVLGHAMGAVKGKEEIWILPVA